MVLNQELNSGGNMPDIVINTDGLIQNTKLTVDGKEITKARKVVDISLYASAPYTSKYSGEKVPGMVGCSFTSVDDKGLMETTRYGQTDIPYGNIGKVKSADEVARFVGHETDKEVETLADKIEVKCKELKVNCPNREVLLSRSIESLNDKALDLGITLEDTREKNEQEKTK